MEQPLFETLLATMVERNQIPERLGLTMNCFCLALTLEVTLFLLQCVGQS